MEIFTTEEKKKIARDVREYSEKILREQQKEYMEKEVIKNFKCIYPSTEKIEKEKFNTYYATERRFWKQNELDIFNKENKGVKEMNVKELRELALINRKEKGIFENYSDFEIKHLTKRQLTNMFNIEDNYYKYKEKK